MENDIFIDTSGFYAVLIRGDNAHKRARKIFQNAAANHRRFVTTDYVLDETVTLLKTRGYFHLADRLMGIIFESGACRVEWMDAERFCQVWRFAKGADDQDWSFTDCFSFWLMERLDLTEVLTKDRHFEHAGFTVLASD